MITRPRRRRRAATEAANGPQRRPSLCLLRCPAATGPENKKAPTTWRRRGPAKGRTRANTRVLQICTIFLETESVPRHRRRRGRRALLFCQKFQPPGRPPFLKSHFRTARPPSTATGFSEDAPCVSLKNSSKIKKINNNEPARARARPRAHARVVVDFLAVYIILYNSVDNYITRGRARKTAEAQSVKIPNWSKIPQFAQNCDKFTNILSENSTPLPKAVFNTPKHFALKPC